MFDNFFFKNSGSDKVTAEVNSQVDEDDPRQVNQKQKLFIV